MFSFKIGNRYKQKLKQASILSFCFAFAIENNPSFKNDQSNQFRNYNKTFQ